jgi:hypothetical protein
MGTYPDLAKAGFGIRTHSHTLLASVLAEFDISARYHTNRNADESRDGEGLGGDVVG